MDATTQSPQGQAGAGHPSAPGQGAGAGHRAGAASHPLERTLYEVKKTIVGQDDLLERMIVALLARGHLLVEGVPGLAKTLAIKALAEAIGGDFKRIQFTPTSCRRT
jgi:MoxR-like ATPase